MLFNLKLFRGIFWWEEQRLFRLNPLGAEAGKAQTLQLMGRTIWDAVRAIAAFKCSSHHN
jgi:hypothetical protein